MFQNFVILNNGHRMPLVGLGTSKSKGSVIKTAIASAVDAGYRHLDCAYIYDNENDIGEALHEIFLERKIKRQDLFIASKLGCSFQDPVCIESTFERTLSNLRLEYIDLYYIHWPFALKYRGPKDYFPCDENGQLLFDETIDYVDTWKALERLYHNGKIKALGLCNFNIEQIERILETCSVIPAVHQFECHPYFSQDNMIEYCKAKGIAAVAYSPLGTPDKPSLTADSVVLADVVLNDIAKKYNKTVAQTVLRYQIQRGLCVVPRSSNPNRIRENINIFDFELSSEDCASIRKLNRDFRLMFPDKYSKHKHFPF